MGSGPSEITGGGRHVPIAIAGSGSTRRAGITAVGSPAAGLVEARRARAAAAWTGEEDAA